MNTLSAEDHPLFVEIRQVVDQHRSSMRAHYSQPRTDSLALAASRARHLSALLELERRAALLDSELRTVARRNIAHAHLAIRGG